MDITFRPANVETDLEATYKLFKELSFDHIVALNGDWPEEFQYKFFKEEFSDPDMNVLIQDDEICGCFCLKISENAVCLKRVYITPKLQGQGIGRRILELGLEKAHELTKPLEVDVLTTNERAHTLYKHIGFEDLEEIQYNWVKLNKMRHKDTKHYRFNIRRPLTGPDFNMGI